MELEAVTDSELLGWSQPEHGKQWVLLAGSPWAWIGYLVALAVLGVLVARYRDSEHDRRRQLGGIAIVAAVAVAALVISMTTGLAEPLRNPILGPSF